MCFSNIFQSVKFYYTLTFINVLRGLIGIFVGFCLIFDVIHVHKHIPADHAYVTLLEALWLIYNLIVVLVAYSLLDAIDRKCPQRMKIWLCFGIVDILGHVIEVGVASFSLPSYEWVAFGGAVFVVSECLIYLAIYRLYRNFKHSLQEQGSRQTLEISLDDFRIDE